MANKKIVKIDEAKCTGCGLCVPKCHKGIIAVVDGKARVMSGDLCDGAGLCLSLCPQGAITVEYR